MKITITIQRITLALTALTMVLATPVAIAAMVEVTNVATGDGSESLFGTDIAQEGANGEIIRLEVNDFVATDSGPGLKPPVTVGDTISLTLNAPPNSLITSVTYVESGTGETTDNSVASVTGSITVGGIPVNFAPEHFLPGESGDWSIPVSLALVGGVRSVDVSIANSLLAFAYEPTAGATIEKTEAVITAGIAPIPIPAAVWLFGSGLLGLIGVARRKKAA